VVRFFFVSLTRHVPFGARVKIVRLKRSRSEYSFLTKRRSRIHFIAKTRAALSENVKTFHEYFACFVTSTNSVFISGSR